MMSLNGLISALLKPGGGLVTCNGLTTTVRGLFISSLLHKLSKPLVVICDKAARAEELVETLRFFMPDYGGAQSLFYFPPWEILPYEAMSPHPEVTGERLSTLIEIGKAKAPYILVTTVEALAYRIIPPKVVATISLRIDAGDSMIFELLTERLVGYGYRRVDIVQERGEFSIRGGIVDIFMGVGEKPIRIELFGDEVESIRQFDPETQRSLEKPGNAIILPFREVFYEGVDMNRLTRDLGSLCDELDFGGNEKESLLENVLHKTFFVGMERLTPSYFPDTCPLFNHLPEEALFIIDEPDSIATHIEQFEKLASGAYREAINRGEPVAKPGQLFITSDDLETVIAEKERVRMSELAVTEEGPNAFIISCANPTRFKGDIQAFIADLKEKLTDNYSVVLAASSAGALERLKRILNDADIGAQKLTDERMDEWISSLNEGRVERLESKLMIIHRKLKQGFILKSDKWMVITDDEILGKLPRVIHRRKKGRKVFGVGIADLATGDLVVHINHGVGRYIRATQMRVADKEDEYLELEYSERQRLFLPISNINLIKKYTGAGGGEPALDRMGGSTWKKTRAKVKKSLLVMAEKLLKLAAERELGGGWKFSENESFHQEFADTFEFEETEDQLAAIADINADMEKNRAMDRLVCGDVGYGKTEVAMRAAFKAVFNGKQVAILAPTTLLTQQHFQTFTERFSSFPVRVESLSRFRTKKEAKEIIAKAAEGSVDILIGTHRLLQKDVSFKNLGLIIIDEEQRFGVTHKEKLKNLKRNVDVLTLTATPIPRTLHTAMVGIRDLSVIETPPQNRVAIKNLITKFSDKMIREAVLREIDRGGQIFFVHNQVRTIISMQAYLHKIVPEAKSAVAHGQMPERELEKVMQDFINKKKDMLIASTIIESGLDIPSANTIIINRADRFGLAQLYQLRGRVGRDRHRAYCYFLIPGSSEMTDIAKRRLGAMEELSDLGSGFRLAARDMEIRGAGNLLGSQQSGQIDAIGFDTYCEMLEDSIKELKGEPVAERFESALNISFQGKISTDYVPGLNQRMELYNRINESVSLQALAELSNEMIDRFGPLPEETQKLFAIMRIKILARLLKITKVDMIRDRLFLIFSDSTRVDPDKLVKAAGKAGRQFKFSSGSGAELSIKGNGWRERLDSILSFLELMMDSSS